MQLDLGIVGLGLLTLISLAYGILVQIAGKPGTDVDWLVAGTGWFVGALVASELVGVGAGARLVDGLAIDAVIVGGGIVGVPLTLVLRLYGDRHSHRDTASA